MKQSSKNIFHNVTKGLFVVEIKTEYEGIFVTLFMPGKNSNNA